jgi:NAD/NADP transhydrogenase beta subunit
VTSLTTLPSVAAVFGGFVGACGVYVQAQHNEGEEKQNKTQQEQVEQESAKELI